MFDGEPYISLVVAARHDDHGGNFMRRLQIFVNALAGQCARHRLPAELVIVEWNPLPDRSRLAEALRWPDNLSWCPVRIVEVPAWLHKRFAHSNELPLYQMIAKNVGIRRARGEFILATNIDIIFNDELMEFLSARNLDARAMYRIDRYDVESDVPLDAPLEEQLQYCSTHVLRINRREGTFAVDGTGNALAGIGRTFAQAGRPPTPAAGDSEDPPREGIRCGKNWFAPETFGGRTFRWVNNNAELLVGAPPKPGSQVELDIEPGPGNRFEPLRLRVTDERGVTIAEKRITRRQYFRFTVPSPGRTVCRVRLVVSGGGRRLASDPRILNFRVFDVRWVSARTSSLLRDFRPLSLLRWEISAAFRRLQTFLARFFGIADPLKYLDCEPPPSAAPGPGPPIRSAELPISPIAGESGPKVTREKSDTLPEVAPADTDATLLHLNGCGDFTLLHRNAWFELRGYPEFDCFSMNIDSVLCLAAHNAGFHETFLADPMRTYHIEHGTGWTPEGEKALYKRIRDKGIPWLEASEVFHWGHRMRYWKSPFVFNLDSWGMRDENLQETVIESRGRALPAGHGKQP
jgi:hypothetical protein